MSEGSISDKVQFARAFYAYFQYYTPPPKGMLAPCKALKKRCTTRKLLAEYIISLCRDSDELEALGVICEACDWAGADMAKETIFWAGKTLERLDDITDEDGYTMAARYSTIQTFLGKALLLENQPDKARDAFEAAYRETDTYANLCRYVDALIREKRYREAINLLKEARARHVSWDAEPIRRIYPEPLTSRQQKNIMVYVRNVLMQLDLKISEIEEMSAISGDE